MLKRENAPVGVRGASLLLAGAMCVIPFLQPRHFSPIRTFYDEWLAFAFGLAAIGLAMIGRRSEAPRIPALSWCLTLFALILFVRGFGNIAAYPQLPFLWSCYALFAALLVVLGLDLATYFGREYVCDVLAAFVLTGALANSIAGVLQVTGIPQPIDAFISYLSGKRAIGNVGQPNLYANYLALGEASLAYLWGRGKIRLSLATIAGLLLLPAAALAASRAYLVYLGYFLFLAWLVLRRYEGGFGRRVCIAAIALAIVGSQLQWIVPEVLRAYGFFIERASSSEWTSGVDASTGLRLLVWQLAWELFAAAPWLGVGPGEFPGAGFAHGLPIELTANLVWTSPHNLLLQLLSETGLVGALPVGIGLFLWTIDAKNEVRFGKSPAMWWIAACVGVEIIHALLEFPLWYAHFLAIAALLMGIGASGGLIVRGIPIRPAIAVCSLAGILGLVSTVYDYARFDLAIAASDGRSLATQSRTIADRAMLRDLRGGLLTPRIELMLFLSLPLDSNDVSEKIAMGERVLRIWPSTEVISRQAIFLAIAGRHEAAVTLLSHGMMSSTSQRKKIAFLLTEAPPAAHAVLNHFIRPATPARSNSERTSVLRY